MSAVENVTSPGQSGLDAGPHLSLKDNGVGRQRQDVDGTEPHHVNQLDPAAGSARRDRRRPEPQPGRAV